MSLWSWLRGAFGSLNPPAFMARPGVAPGLQVRLYWKVLPVDVYVLNGLEQVQDACAWWNILVGRRLFREPIEAIPDVIKAMTDPAIRPFMTGIMVKGGGSDPNHGSTDIEYDKRSGAMLNAIVELPETTNRPGDVVRHELGHALGLDHGPDWSLMAAHLPSGTKPLVLAGYQLDALRQMGG